MSVTVRKKRDNWFRNYQEIPGMIEGKRSWDGRITGFDKSDFAGKSVLDLGCNIGQMCLFAAECGARSVLGVEFDKDAFLAAMLVRDEKGTSVIKYKLDDLDNPLFWGHIGRYDTVLLLSVIDTKELVNPLGILSRACMKCKGVLYFEGHRHEPRAKYFRQLLDNTDFTQIEHVAHCEGRDLFRCSRDVLDSDGFHVKLAEAMRKYHKIAVVGNQMVGKSTLCRGALANPTLSKATLMGGLEKDGFTIMDDCNDLDRINACEKLVLFDYRAGLYADDWDVLFNVVQPPEKFESIRRNSRYLRSAEMERSETMCCLYTVRTH